MCITWFWWAFSSWESFSHNLCNNCYWGPARKMKKNDYESFDSNIHCSCWFESLNYISQKQKPSIMQCDVTKTLLAVSLILKNWSRRVYSHVLWGDRSFLISSERIRHSDYSWITLVLCVSYEKTTLCLCKVPCESNITQSHWAAYND